MDAKLILRLPDNIIGDQRSGLGAFVHDAQRRVGAAVQGIVGNGCILQPAAGKPVIGAVIAHAMLAKRNNVIDHSCIFSRAPQPSKYSSPMLMPAAGKPSRS